MKSQPQKNEARSRLVVWKEFTIYMNIEHEFVIPKNTEPINFTNYTDGQLTPNFTLYTVDDIFKSSRLFIIISCPGSFFSVLHLLSVCGSFRIWSMNMWFWIHFSFSSSSFYGFFFLSVSRFKNEYLIICSVKEQNGVHNEHALHYVTEHRTQNEQKPIHFPAHNIVHISNLHIETFE